VLTGPDSFEKYLIGGGYKTLPPYWDSVTDSYLIYTESIASKNRWTLSVGQIDTFWNDETDWNNITSLSEIQDFKFTNFRQVRYVYGTIGDLTSWSVPSETQFTNSFLSDNDLVKETRINVSPEPRRKEFNNFIDNVNLANSTSRALIKQMYAAVANVADVEEELVDFIYTVVGTPDYDAYDVVQDGINIKVSESKWTDSDFDFYQKQDVNGLRTHVYTVAGTEGKFQEAVNLTDEHVSFGEPAIIELSESRIVMPGVPIGTIFGITNGPSRSITMGGLGYTDSGTIPFEHSAMKEHTSFGESPATNVVHYSCKINLADDEPVLDTDFETYIDYTATFGTPFNMVLMNGIPFAALVGGVWVSKVSYFL
jgi:hypothetical protein